MPTINNQILRNQRISITDTRLVASLFGAKFTGLLDEIPGAAFALSSQLLSRSFLNKATSAPVRRTSDNVEANVKIDQSADPKRITLDSPITITSGVSATTTLGELVNEEVVTYESDFSAGSDSWTGVRVAAAGNIDGIGAEDNNLRLRVNATDFGMHYCQVTALVSLGFTYRFKARVYIDSTLGQCDGVQLSLGDGTSQAFTNLQKDTWHELEFVGVNAGPVAFARFTLMRGSNTSYSDAEMEDTLYVRDIELTALTHSAALVTGTDQSGNGNDATQITTNAQPLIVEAGVLVPPTYSGAQFLEVPVFDATPEFTYIATFTKTANGNGAIFSKWNTSGQRSVALFISNVEATYRLSADGSTFEGGVFAGSGIILGQTYHIAMRLDSEGALSFFVDGVMVDSVADMPAPYNSTAPLYIGQHNDGNWQEGSISNLIVYDRALDADAIAAIHAAL